MTNLLFNYYENNYIVDNLHDLGISYKLSFYCALVRCSLDQCYKKVKKKQNCFIISSIIFQFLYK